MFFFNIGECLISDISFYFELCKLYIFCKIFKFLLYNYFNKFCTLNFLIDHFLLMFLKLYIYLKF